MKMYLPFFLLCLLSKSAQTFTVGFVKLLSTHQSTLLFGETSPLSTFEFQFYLSIISLTPTIQSEYFSILATRQCL